MAADIAQITGSGALAVVVLREVLNYLSKRNGKKDNSKSDTRLAKLEVKVDTLWEVYAMDAMKAARTQGFIERKSPAKPTPKWNGVIGEKLGLIILQEIQERKKQHLNSYDIAVEIYYKHKESLKIICQEKDVPISVIFGTILELAEG